MLKKIKRMEGWNAFSEVVSRVACVFWGGVAGHAQNERLRERTSSDYK